MKSVEVRKATNAKDVANQAAEEIIQSLIQLTHSKNHVHLGLTGGTVGILTLESLASKFLEHKIDISKIHFWWGDERFVSSSSPERNANKARRALLDVLNLNQHQIHEFPSSDNDLDLQIAKETFTAHFVEVFGLEPIKMDLLILGMGPDGHVASLFPGQEHQGELVVSVANSPKPPAQRLSFSMDLINRSEKVVFVVSGLDKAEATESVHKNPECDLPAAKVSALGQTLWFIDEAAGAAFWSC